MKSKEKFYKYPVNANDQIKYLKSIIKNDRVKISVIVPVYNVEEYIQQCLDSIVNQTLKEIEIICVNDGSTDNSPQILEEYAKKDKRIKIINKKNAGLGAARNTGMEHATGEYIGFIDSDDWVDLGMFKKLYSNAKSQNSDMVMCPIYIVDDSNQKLDYDFPYFNLDYFNEDFYNNVFTHKKTEDFFFRICVTSYNKIYRTKFLKKINANFPEGLIFEDNPFFYKTFLSAKSVSLVKDFLYYYRVNRANSIISNVDKKYFDVIKIQNLNKNIFLETNNFEFYKMDFYNYAMGSIINRYSKVDEKYREEFFNLIKQFFKEMDLKNNEINNLNSFIKNKYNNIINSNSHTEFELREENSYLVTKIDQLATKLNINANKSAKDSIVEISIILPVFNVENYLKDALESIVRQTIGLEHLEVIMINDCSTDNSGRIMDEYASKYDNFKAIHLPENSGAAGKPRNIGIENATGDYLMFLDSDDYYTDDACETLYKTAIKENADIVFGNYVTLYDKPVITKTTFGNKSKIKIDTIKDEPQILTISPSLWTKIYKKDFIVNNNIKFPENIPGQDLVFIMHAFLKAHGILFLNKKIIVNYRLRNEDNLSITYSRSKESISGLIKAYNITYEVFKKHYYEDYFSIVCSNHLPYWAKHFILSDLNPSERMEILKESQPLFEKYKNYNLEPTDKSLRYLFKLLCNQRYKESLLVINGLRNLLKRQEQIKSNMNNTRKQLNIKQSEMTHLLTTSGYLKYKFNNIYARTKNKLKNPLFQLKRFKMKT